VGCRGAGRFAGLAGVPAAGVRPRGDQPPSQGRGRVAHVAANLRAGIADGEFLRYVSRQFSVFDCQCCGAEPEQFFFFQLIAVENEDTGQTFLNHCDRIKLAQ